MKKNLLIAAVFASSLAAHATTYDYTGVDFSIVTNSYSTSDSVTGSFTTASPLGDNLTNATISATSFSFYDGVRTINNMNGYAEVLDISTDASGNIVDWNVDVAQGGPLSYIAVTGGPLTTSPGDATQLTVGNYGISESSGVWTTVQATPSPVPEPSSLALLGTGALGLAAAIRRRLA
jgi:hypothetical protein